MGQRDYDEALDRRLSGLYASVTSGRSVTFALQSMRGHVEGFEPWYERVQERLKVDPVCRWFVELRNRIEKQGDHGRMRRPGHLHHLDTAMMREMKLKAPPGTVGTFMGDELVRHGWNVMLPNGSTTQVYFSLPQEVFEIPLLLRNAPGNRDVGELLSEYLDTVESVVEDAERKFLGKEPTP